MREKSRTIFLPEAGQPVIDAIAAHHNTGLEVVAEDMPLLSENGQHGALERLKSGEFAAVIAGAKYSSADVIRAGLEVIGAEDGLISSFFAMEENDNPEDKSNFFLADCAVVPSPDKSTLVKIAEQTCTNVERLGVKPIVGFLSSKAEQEGSTDELDEAIALFKLQNPSRTTVGRIGLDEAKDERLYHARTGKHYPESQRPNVFVLQDLNTGNILYKALQDPDASGWHATATDHNSYLLEKSGQQLIFSNFKNTESLSTTDAVELAKRISSDVNDPVVAFLSFSTEGSSKHADAARVSLIAKEFRSKYPDIPSFGEIQWDSARDEHIYQVKTGKSYPNGKAPNVFIFPNQDSADFVLKVMCRPATKGLTAVGPILQGFKDGTLLIDLSRGVDETAGIAVVRLTAKLAGLKPEMSTAKAS